MRTFAGIENEYAEFFDSAILLQPIPYDGTSTWGKGADKGYQCFLEASENMELYDIETDTEVYQLGIHILPEIMENSSPERVFSSVRKRVSELLNLDKFLTFFGGEHSVSIGIIEAFRDKYRDLTVLQLDAHTDLRPEYLGSAFNHACAMHKACLNTNLIQVGIRSMDVSEKQYIRADHCFLARDIFNSNHWFDQAVELMTEKVYISIDLDVFDPSVMPATGTPEPGGLSWYQVIRFLKYVFEKRDVVGFDIVEFSPIENLRHPQFLVAKLYYKLLSYKFKNYG